MNKYKLIIPLVLVGILSGCGFPLNNQTAVISERVEQTKNTDKKVVQKMQNNMDGDQEIKKDTDDNMKDNSKNVGGTVYQKPRGEKPDLGDASNVENTKYSWGLKLNNEHKTPGIPGYVKEMLKKYDGIFTGDINKKFVYLTFDEGYENGYTPKILDTLRDENVKAIFFITGPYLKKNANLVKRMIDEGHIVGNHTVNHPSLPDLDDTKLKKELYDLDKQFYSMFGINFKYMRPPKGEFSKRVLAASQDLGYKTVFWSFAYKDCDVNHQQGPEHAYKVVMDNLHNGAVILLHAVSSDNAEALDSIIKGIREEGYEIRPFDL